MKSALTEKDYKRPRLGLEGSGWAFLDAPFLQTDRGVFRGLRRNLETL